MSFVSLGGTEASRPTFFELLAAERLMPSLKAAASYSLSVLAQHRPWCYRLLGYEDELFALITAFLDYGSLSGNGATFAESLYSLRRAGTEGDESHSANQSGAGSSGGSGSSQAAASSHAAQADGQLLTRRQRRQALLLSALLPYLHAKLVALFELHRTMPSALPGLAEFQARQQRSQQQQGPRREQEQQQDVQGQPLEALRHSLARWKERARSLALAAFLKAYPFVHAGQEGSKFLFQLLYLLESSPFYSPGLWLLGQRIVRVSGNELVAAEQRKSRLREAALNRARQTPQLLVRLVRLGYLRLSWLFTDHTRNALILSVFAFKALEWWYTSAEGKLAEQEVLPPPPPPPPPPPHPQGMPLPSDPSVCAICLQQRTNPALIEASGYAFCYPCAYRFVLQHSCCPVTRFPASVENVRRVFQSM